ncbi:LacI family DNA-binding transcriptional regulator [Sphaerisporangium fuscum]|uniref:LacI family DNA-binding transcriptional regulator n=1 Tax=Sphaerisporangium fuscum TaxID=2835868 RepID=UPI002029A9D1|nr:LacI family DNA-binding transcriptional regulator [Sphaerisporangium fuscum]
MADVARHAGVSVSTVSHVINETRVVKEETRQRVLDAINETGYIHNTIAKSLVSGSTKSIGLAISAITNFYFADIVSAIEVEVSRAGYTLLLTDTHDDPDNELRVVAALHQRRVDGVLLAPSTGPRGRALRYLHEVGVPTVLVDRCASPRFDQIGTENVEATAELVGHLAGHGHQRIAMISGHSGLRTTVERLEGYRQGLRRHDLAFDERLSISGNSNADDAEKAVRTLFDRDDPPTALVVANNHMTIGVMRALGGLGVEVPGDVALTAFDDFEWAAHFRPRLTTVAQRIAEIGGGAVRMLLERIEQPGRKPRTVRLPPRFMRRESCGCP